MLIAEHAKKRNAKEQVYLVDLGFVYVLIAEHAKKRNAKN